MIPWELLDSAPVPGSRGELRLYRRGEEFSIRVDAEELMSSRAHGSEEALARIACDRIADRPRPRVLIGGLGMGYTLAAALRRLCADAEVVVAELAPAVVKWNRGPLAGLAGAPLEDRRVAIVEGDVARVLQAERGGYDAILLDVDNGPEGFTRKSNDWLYARAGLAATFAALRPEGVLAVWSATPDRAFAYRLRCAGFKVEDLRVPATAHAGREHTIWIAARRPK
jgi:spermidine synthase